MDRLRERLKTARRALRTLSEAQALDVQPVVKRDAAILRFTYTFEAVWKTAQLYLAEVELGACEESTGKSRITSSSARRRSKAGSYWPRSRPTQ